MGGGTSFPRDPLDRDKVFLVTGGNTGIGYENAKWIAMLGAKVIIACRSEARAKQAIENMQADFEEEKRKGTRGIISEDKIDVQFMPLDLSSFQSTMKFVEIFKSSGLKLNVLICNAGLSMTELESTENGHESMLQVNYLSHFIIITHLIPFMEQSGIPDCRVVLVSSAGHEHLAPRFNINSIKPGFFNDNNFKFMEQYGATKLYQVMQMFAMNRRMAGSNVTITSLHPGFVKTDLARHVKKKCCWACLFVCFKCVMIKPYDGAETQINAAINPKFAGTRDIYFDKCKPTTPSSQARNVEYQEALLKLTLELLQEYIPPDQYKRWASNVQP